MYHGLSQVLSGEPCGACYRTRSGITERSSVPETYHIELLGSEEPGAAAPSVRHRVSVRSAGVEGAKERALRLFARARAPQRGEARAEAVRVLDGAGTEVFRWSRFDEPGG